MKGKRRIKGGRSPIRTVLQVAMLRAIQHNPGLRNRYQKLVAQGKHQKVAITACMRKMSSLLHSIVRNNRVWQTNYKPQMKDSLLITVAGYPLLVAYKIKECPEPNTAQTPITDIMPILYLNKAIKAQTPIIRENHSNGALKPRGHRT